MEKITKASLHPLAVQAVQLKDALGRAKLWRTMHKMDAVTREIGYELAGIATPPEPIKKEEDAVMRKTKQWTMPQWMEPYRTMIADTGGASVESLMSADPSLPFDSYGQEVRCIAVNAQVALLERMRRGSCLRS